MFKYPNNPVFWTNFLVILVSLAGISMRNSVQALNVAALFFLIWLAFLIGRSSYARKHEIFLPRPDGVCVAGPEKLGAVPSLYLLTDVLTALVCLVFAWNWPAFWTVLVIGLLGGLLIWKSVK